MIIRPRQIIALYFNSWWIPAVMTLVALAAFTITSIPHWPPLAILRTVFAIVLGLSFLGVLSASIWNFVKKQWAKGIINLLALPVCGVISDIAYVFLMYLSMFSPPTILPPSEAKLRFVKATGISIPATAQVLSYTNTHDHFHGDGHFSIIFQFNKDAFARVFTNEAPWDATNWNKGPVTASIGMGYSFGMDNIVSNLHSRGKPPTYYYGPEALLDLYQRTNVWWRYRWRYRERVPNRSSSGYLVGDFILLDPMNHQIWYSD